MVGTGALIGQCSCAIKVGCERLAFIKLFDTLSSTEIQTNPILKLLILLIFVDICFTVFRFLSFSLSLS